MSDEQNLKDTSETGDDAVKTPEGNQGEGSTQDAKAQEPAQGKDADVKKDDKAKAPRADVAVFANKIEIDCKKELPYYSNGEVIAYRAYSKDQNRTPLIALVCERHLVPRRKAIELYNKIINPNLAKLVSHGVVFWPPEDKQRYVFIYLDNLGKPILLPGGKQALGWKQDDVMSAIVKPMVSILQDFRDKEFVHGNIRPSNMFSGSEGDKVAKVLLGDCLAAPPSAFQPALYETIQRAMADPIAKGKGTMADDIYALGVSIAVIMRQHDPLEGLDTKGILKRKMMHGSYATITGKDRFKGEILELLRGVLHDEPSQRWTIDEVMAWIDGRRLTPKQAVTTKKAPRPFILGEEKYYTTPQLAMDIDERPKAIRSVIEDETLQVWLERSLEDEDCLMRLEKAVVDAKQSSTGSGYEYCLVSNVSIALDPDAPLRYKGRKIIGDGVGTAMVSALAQKQSVSIYAEVFLNSIILNWLGVQNDARVDVTGLFGKFEKCRRYLKTSKYGEGVERALYVLAPEAPCLSDLLDDYYVTEPEHLLHAFEDLCSKGKAPSTFLDKHVVAFLYEKDQKVIEPYLYDLNTHENHRVVGATIKCLAAIQRRYKLDATPGIAKVMAPRLQAVIRRYHDRKVQEKMKESVAEFQGSGDITKVAAMFENADVVKKDFTAFKKAMLEFARLEEERLKLNERLEDKDKFGLSIGREVSAVFSCALAVIVILAIGFMFFTDKTPF